VKNLHSEKKKISTLTKPFSWGKNRKCRGNLEKTKKTKKETQKKRAGGGEKS